VPAPRPALVRVVPWLLALVLLALAGAVVAVRGRSATPPLPHLATLPAFTLVERSGRPVTLDSLRGRVWVADFIFTSCAGICPAMTARMARLRREVDPDIVFVSFTVDPARDTPAVLSRYATAVGAGEGWLFVTGPQKALYDLSVGGFKLAAMEVPAGEQAPGGDGPFLHSSKFVLVDGAGAVRGYYDSDDGAEMAGLARDVARLRAGG
jgi:cytochrome oxidase Cu insertion factor (SCO1/SenC/PrrC family)